MTQAHIYTRECEKNYESSIDRVAEEVISKNKKLVFMAGASCSGKTTTSRKIAEKLYEKGKNAQFLSLDDFYLDPKLMPVGNDGVPDYESPETLDLPYIADVMNSIESGTITETPLFDFKRRCRSAQKNIITPSEATVIVIEGLHALNPRVTGNADSYRVYLNCESEQYDAKLLRRLVRDVKHRNAAAELTFSLWKNVRQGEDKYIKPYISTADMVIDTYFDYERSVMKAEAERLLSSVDRNSRYFSDADGILKMLKEFTHIPSEAVPEGSMIWEFIGA